MNRWIDHPDRRGRLPLGGVSREIARALREELGPELIHSRRPRQPPPVNPAGGPPAPSEDSPMAPPTSSPETLLVSCEHDRVFTTSLKIAEHFRKRHTHVLRAVESLLKDLLSEPRIGPSEEFAGLEKF